jgi:hypothetical protein
VAHIGERRHKHKILVGIPEMKRQFKRKDVVQRIILNWVLTISGKDAVDWILSSQFRKKW